MSAPQWPSGKFRTIYADPPWPYRNRATRGAANNHYAAMSLHDICTLPVHELAADESHLHLWTTNAFLLESRRVLEAWGFKYEDIFVWVKPQLGLGNYWRVSTEYLVLGVKGNLPFQNNEIRSWLEHNRIGHSKKPDAIRKLIEQVSPSPRIELFARKRSPGWEVWGNEVNHFSSEDFDTTGLGVSRGLPIVSQRNPPNPPKTNRRRKMSKQLKERIGFTGIDVKALAEFLAKLEETGLIHVNRRRLKRL